MREGSGVGGGEREEGRWHVTAVLSSCTTKFGGGGGIEGVGGGERVVGGRGWVAEWGKEGGLVLACGVLAHVGF
jgi:hypothetical protein